MPVWSGHSCPVETVIPKISQETLAEMVGTTRSRVSVFMNRFRKLGFIDYHASEGLQIHSSLLNIVFTISPGAHLCYTPPGVVFTFSSFQIL
jgi:CRP/FNR family cyclic AMP-dependent transcriptional regulator